MWFIYEYYASNGGIINGAIFCTALVVLYIGSGKLILFYRWNKLMSQQSLTAGEQIAGFPLSTFEVPEDDACRRKFYENMFRERLLEILPSIENGLDTMAVIIQAAPLLGLFGTVVGMIKTFSLITTYGTSNPVILTEGITVSLLTTQAGLLVAFPCMLFHTYVQNRKNELVKKVLTRAEQDVNVMTCKKKREQCLMILD